MTKDYLRVGKIINTHGIKGEVKVLRITDFADRFEPGSTLWVDKKQSNELIKVTVDGHRRHKGFDLVHFQSLDNINEVESWKGSELLIKREQLEPLEENEYYYHEIIGCHVYTTEPLYVGKVIEILAPGANDVWVVEDENGSEHLIPYIEPVVQTIDIEKSNIIIEPMEGLLE
ncbi:ribosome maturation factor RimM [Gracilibacillus sp. YIM 98692]|uniref:ribosome maturation factor RimM n=1 Tax=Gracilibacillus sp. YIM 98692 TaxID=2663532 RepID=UPI0013D61316|nr:ribosome maturation factor RimM [Gracilibacillus sp. YIM 98692]